VAEPVQIKFGLVRRFDLLAVANPRSVRRGLWFNGAVGLWDLIGAVSVAGRASLGDRSDDPATAALSGFIWWLLRRSMRRIPETRQWVDALSTS